MGFGFPSAVLTSLIATDSCYYVIGGISDSIFPYSPGSIFCKFDLEGELQFSKTIIDPQGEYWTWRPSLIEKNGEFSTCGYTYQGNYYSLYVRYNEVGDTLFTRIFENYFDPNRLIVGADLINVENDFYLLSGLTHPVGSSFHGDLSIIKLDSSGDFKFQKIYGDILNDRPLSLTTLDNNEIIMGVQKSNTHNTNQGFEVRSWIIGIDSLGEIQWEFLSSEDQLQVGPNAMVSTYDNGLVVASGIGEESPVNANASDLLWWDYVFKLDADHNVEWEVTLRDPFKQEQTHLNSIVTCSDSSGYVVAGTSAVGETDVTGILYGRIAKISLEGDSLWDRRYVYPDEEALYVFGDFYDLKETGDGGFIICGEVDATGVNHPFQAWLMKVDEYGCLVPGCQDVNSIDEEKEEIGINLFPNPTTDYLNIYLPPGANDGTFSIVNLEGKQMKQFSAKYGDSTYVVDVSDFSSGVYFLHYSRKGKVVNTQKFIIQ